MKGITCSRCIHCCRQYVQELDEDGVMGAVQRWMCGAKAVTVSDPTERRTCSWYADLSRIPTYKGAID